jgi:hypothetical protein
MDVNRAPPWNDTPMLAAHIELFALAGARHVHAEQPHRATRRPASAEPSMCLSKVLLPDPEPPMITRISPAFTLKSTPCRMRRLAVPGLELFDFDQGCRSVLSSFID